MAVIVQYEGNNVIINDLFQTVGDLKSILSSKVGKQIVSLKRLNSEEELNDSDNRFALGGFGNLPIVLKAK